MPEWTRFGFPRMWDSDALEVCQILLDLGIKDPRMEQSIELIRSKRASDGKWTNEGGFHGRFAVPIEKINQPSKWITYSALAVLDAWDS